MYFEDTSTTPTGGLGKIQNVRMSNATWGKMLFYAKHLAAQEGICVVTVPARGTSSFCPRCLSPLTHVKASDRLDEQGHAWAYCSSKPKAQKKSDLTQGCSYSANRDHSGAQRVLTRGLAGQPYTKMVPDTNVGSIRKSIDVVISVRTSSHYHTQNY